MASRKEKKLIWITWERQRRSLSLAKLLGAELYLYQSSLPRLFRYLILSVRTILLLSKQREGDVIVQNPSMILTALSCILKKVFSYRLIVDRHSNFLLTKKEHNQFFDKLFFAVSNYTLRKADFTIVTNQNLATKIQNIAKETFVLQDPYPELSNYKRGEIEENSVLYVCSWAQDEPIEEVLEAARSLPNTTFYLSGKPKSEIEDLPANCRLTGYLLDDEYFELMSKAAAVLVLTTMPMTLVCGAYESVAMGKSLVLSKTNELEEYFSDAALYVENTRDSIALGVEEAIESRTEREKRVAAFYLESGTRWQESFEFIRDEIGKL